MSSGEKASLFAQVKQMKDHAFHMAGYIVEAFREHVGIRKGELFEEQGYDYRLKRGLSTLLKRIFEPESQIDPIGAREFTPIAAEDLLKQYYMSFTQRLLIRSHQDGVEKRGGVVQAH